MNKKSDNTAVLMKFLLLYCHVNVLGPDWQGDLKRSLENLNDQTISDEFKHQLRQAITDNTVSAEELEFGTGWDLESEDEKMTG